MSNWAAATLIVPLFSPLVIAVSSAAAADATGDDGEGDVVTAVDATDVGVVARVVGGDVR